MNLARTVCLVAFLSTPAWAAPTHLAFGMPGPADMLDSADVTANIAERFDLQVEKLLRDQFDQARTAFLAARLEYDWSAAEDAARKARLMAENAHDAGRLALADALLGTALVQQSRYREAEPILQRAYRALEQQQGEAHIHTLWVLARQQEIRLRQGRLAECLSHARALPAQAEGDAEKEERIAAVLDARYWPALAALQLGRMQEAEEAIAALRRDSERSRHKAVQRERAKMHELAALLQQQRGRWEEAASEAREALSLRRRTDPDSGSTVQGTLFLAQLLQAGDRRKEAGELARSAADMALRTLGPQDLLTGQALRLRAMDALERGRTEAARADLAAALDIFRTVGVRAEQADAARELARLLRKAGKDGEAEAHYLEALDQADALFASTRGLAEGQRQRLLERYLPYYHEGVEFLLEREAAAPNAGQGARALETVSRMQSRIFSELLRLSLAGQSAGDAAFQAQVKTRDAAQSRIDRLAERLLRLPKAGDDEILAGRVARMAADLRAERETARSALAESNARLWREHPRPMELAEPRPVRLQALQGKILRADETLLSYYLQANRVVLFLVQRDRFLVRSVAQGEQEVATLVQRVRQAMSQEQRLEPADLHRLYRLLLEPVADVMGQRVTVVGDGPLHALPLEMLLTQWDAAQQTAFKQDQQRGDDPYSRLAYAGSRWRFSYLPSLAALVAAREAPSRPGGYRNELVSFADPVFSPSEQDRSPSVRGVRLARLQETAEEAEAISSLLGGKSSLLLRQAAQESRAKGLQRGEARYLHFATHGLLGGEFLQLQAERAPMPHPGPLTRSLGVVAEDETDAKDAPPVRAEGQPALALTLAGDLHGEDGLLTLAEVIQHLRTDAELVVLSACNTAGEGGRPGGGEGFSGMTRGFMFAGARGLYVSHWSVESLATRDLMIEAFKRLRTGAKPVDALAEAREVLRSKPGRGHPLYWAPFVYLGP
ncbi:MAG: CHAT domain-containing protein [Betaproteobacteria bacterium]|nr:CHAT domain-containing protein [Betaproteobacteria bacterium]